MESFGYLAQGFEAALSPSNLFYRVVGVLWGTVVGVLPGLGPLAGLARLLPLTFRLDAQAAIIMLAGIFIWRDVRRIDDLYPGAHPGRGGLRDHLPGHLHVRAGLRR